MALKLKNIITYPTFKEVEDADRPTLYRIWKDLPEPGTCTEDYESMAIAEMITKEERIILDRILERLKELGAFCDV